MPAQRPAQAFVPSRYYAMLLDVLAERGHARADLLRLAGVATEALGSDEGYLTLLQVEALVGRACAVENTDALGLEVGKRLQLMSHGSLSMAALTAPTVAAAVDLVVQCFPLIMPLFALSVQPRGTATGVRLHVRFPLDAEVERFHTATMSGSLYAQLHFLLGGALPKEVELDARHPRPPGLPSWVDTLDIALRFDQPHYELRVPTSVLALPLPLADARAHASARKRCLDELASRPDPARTSSLVMHALSEHGPPFPDLTDVSRALALSTRSLRRRLSEEGTSFRQLQGEARLALAERFLADPRRSITEIGLSLGYADAANFSRAFRAARGCTPHEARAALLGATPRAAD